MTTANIRHMDYKHTYTRPNYINYNKLNYSDSDRREDYPSLSYILGCLLTKYPKLALYGSIMLLASIALTAILCLSGPAVNAQSDHLNQKYYTSIQVNAGDTLWDIAQEYKTAEYSSTKDYVEEVKEINHLTNDTITTGCYLTVPYYAEHPGVTAN